MGELAMEYNEDHAIEKSPDEDASQEWSVEDMTRFADSMDKMDTQASLEIVEQHPEFHNFALGIVDSMQKAQEAAHADNRESQAQVHEGWQEIRGILSGQLDSDELTPEERSDLNDRLMETGMQESAKDSENKQFVKDVVRDVLKYGSIFGSVVVITAGVVYAGVKGGFGPSPGGNA
jgi:hypothetical protein